MCMKEAYMFLTAIVPGPHNPKLKIDVYLQPLIKELTLLWETGVEAFDISKKQNFQLRAALMWTINDFPAYSMLSGWSTGGNISCPYCMEETQSFSLKHGGKTTWRDRKNILKGHTVTRPPPTVRTGEEILNQICELGIRKVTELDAQEVNKRICNSCGWKKRSIFWDLPYWSSNLIRHNLDVMHIEKNVFDNVFNTVLNVVGKTKDNLKARLDIAKILRSTAALTELSLFFKDLTSTVLRVVDLERLEVHIPQILCKLECIFPPGFFNSMEHLPVHLPYEARIAGPVQYRWMYPFERYLRTLKNMIGNKASVEGSICEAYLMAESTQLFSHYFEPHVISRHQNVARNNDGGVVEDIEKEIMYVQRLQEEFPNLSQDQIDESLETYFSIWFKEYVRSNHIENKYMRSLAHGPLIRAYTYPMCFFNGYKFHTLRRGSARSTMNSGVCISGPNVGDYYGRIQEIIQVEYREAHLKQTTLFKCEWFDPTMNVGVKEHNQYKLVDVNHRRRFDKSEPFILAMQANQLY
ncbi:uncharacterized protein LOC132619827 [Lycium barbarum]|uniref:uncharacterized protein LOC132619827 n=1 Tax=Lycium barbarum TaxID=112863 RepID=UPI00293EB563|nr:uncharacterized protein LOC132619827 [Lycium barbarum]